MIGANSMNGSGISAETLPTPGSPKVPKYVAPPSYNVEGPALAGFENTNRVLVEKSSSKVEGLLEERGKRYGTFRKHAQICQSLKFVIDRELLNCKPRPIDDDMKQALDVICDKIARIINGDETYVDNWDDIAGYATLVSKRLTDGN